MADKMKATVRLTFEVEFEDNGEDATLDQAMEAAQEKIPSGFDADIEIIHIQRPDEPTDA